MRKLVICWIFSLFLYLPLSSFADVLDTERIIADLPAAEAKSEHLRFIKHIKKEKERCLNPVCTSEEKQVYDELYKMFVTDLITKKLEEKEWEKSSQASFASVYSHQQ